MENNCVQRLIDESEWVKFNFGDNFLKVGEFYSITKKFKDYFHSGVYRLEFNVIQGLYFSLVGLNLTEDEDLGVSQWLLQSTIPLNSFWKGDKNIISDFNKYIEDTDINILPKNHLFDSNIEISWRFIMQALSNIERHGIEVPDNLYPTERNENYDHDKTIEFIKKNLFKV